MPQRRPAHPVRASPANAPAAMADAPPGRRFVSNQEWLTVHRPLPYLWSPPHRVDPLPVGPALVFQKSAAVFGGALGVSVLDLLAPRLQAPRPGNTAS